MNCRHLTSAIPQRPPLQPAGVHPLSLQWHCRAQTRYGQSELAPSVRIPLYVTRTIVCQRPGAEFSWPIPGLVQTKYCVFSAAEPALSVAGRTGTDRLAVNCRIYFYPGDG